MQGGAAGGWRDVWGKQKDTETRNRQEHGTKITAAQGLVEMATKKVASARKNLENIHKEKQESAKSDVLLLLPNLLGDSWISAILM